MAEDRSPSPDRPDRTGRPRRRVRARPDRPGGSRPTGEGRPAGRTALDTPRAERHPRPWEVDPKAERAAAARRRDPERLLADVPEGTVIAARNLTKHYEGLDRPAVDSLDLTIRSGEVFGLLGPNGAGKTTTVLMLLGLTEPSEGVVRVVGLDPVRNPLAVKRQVGYLPDNVGFYAGMTGRENLRYTARLNGIGRREAEARIDELLAEVRLDDAADREAGTYSRGMRQRLGIADALVKDPSVLILDEPTIAIDPAGVEELLALLRRLVRERNLTVMLSSHILGQVQSLCDRVGFFAKGRLVAAGPLAELAGGAEQAHEFEVGIDGPSDRLDPVARGVPGVTDVRPDERNDALRIVTATGDVAAALAGAIAREGLSLVHLRRRGGDLLELYRRFVPEEA